MERYASTLAATAACVGLLVAGHLMIVRQRATVPDVPVKVRTVAPPAETVSWSDPPAKPDTRAAATSGTVPPTAWTASAPASEQALAVEPAANADAQTVVQAPVQQAALKQDKAKRTAEQARRKRIAQAKARRTQTASRETAVGVQEAAPQAQPAPTHRVDPITDLLRGLGIGRQG